MRWPNGVKWVAIGPTPDGQAFGACPHGDSRQGWAGGKTPTEAVEALFEMLNDLKQRAEP